MYPCLILLFVHLGLDFIKKVVKCLDFRVIITIDNFWASSIGLDLKGEVRYL